MAFCVEEKKALFRGRTEPRPGGGSSGIHLLITTLET